MGGCCSCSKKRTRDLNTAQARRKFLATNPLIIQRNLPDDIEIIREYVDTGKGHMISTSCFRPKDSKTKLKGMICYCQGYASYIDWTDTDVAIQYVHRGYIVVSNDHYGHGRSDGNWLTNPTSSHDTYVNDATYIFERAKRKYTPIEYINNNQKFHYYLLGHSLGGAISIEVSKQYTSSSYYLRCINEYKDNYGGDNDHKIDEQSPLQKHDALTQTNDYIPSALLNSCSDLDKNLMNNCNDSLFGWDGCILSAPMVKIKDDLKPPGFLITIGSYVQSLIPDARIVPTGVKYEYLTRDKDYFDNMLSVSPLRYDDNPTVRTGLILINLCEHIEKTMHNIKIPLLIMHGEKDKITDPTMSQILYDRCGSKEKTIKIFDGAYHGLMFDTCKSEVFDTVDKWIMKRNKLINGR